MDKPRAYFGGDKKMITCEYRYPLTQDELKEHPTWPDLAKQALETSNPERYLMVWYKHHPKSRYIPFGDEI